MSDARQFFQQAPLYTDEVVYVLLRFPPQRITLAAALLAEVGEAFSALVADKDEVTLILAQEVLEDFGPRLAETEQSGPYRLLTFDLPLPPDLTGFMALCANLLAEAKIPIIPLGAFGRDHLLIPAPHFEQAWQLLKRAQNP
jgi:hypothetical protein